MSTISRLARSLLASPLFWEWDNLVVDVRAVKFGTVRLHHHLVRIPGPAPTLAIACHAFDPITQLLVVEDRSS